MNRHSGRWLAFLALLAFQVPAPAPAGEQAPARPAAGVQAPSPAASPAPSPAVTPGASPVAGGPAPDIVIFYTGEVMGWTEPCG